MTARNGSNSSGKMMKLTKYACVALLILGASLKVDAVLDRSKATGRQGTLAGMVLDPNKARVPRAKILLETNGFKQEITTADDGSYSIDLPEGKYKIRVERDGFYTFRMNGIRIVSGGLVKLDVVIKGIRNDIDHP